jgi:hypothetical protein
MVERRQEMDENAPNGPTMDAATRLAAYAVIELTVRQIGDPSLTQDHRDELAVIMKDVDAQMVALEIATVLTGVAVGHVAAGCCDIELGSMIDEMRARVVAEG